MMTRTELVGMLNNAGVGQLLGSLQRALVMQAAGQLLGVPQESEDLSVRELDRRFLANIGPAAASSAMAAAMEVCNHKLQKKGFKLTNNILSNHNRLVKNDDCYSLYSGALRQYLLPRYAYLDFDSVVDPRHHLDRECGYPKSITPMMYRYMYDRDDTGRRVTDFYSDEIWAVEPLIYDDDDDEVETDFEAALQELKEDHLLYQYLYRMSKMAGVGHFGALLIGLDDGKALSEPVDEPDLLKGLPNPIAKNKRNLLYLRPFDEYLSFVQQYETDTSSPRFGLPVLYNLVFMDMTIDVGGAALGTRQNQVVHWTRVVHVADNLLNSRVFGTPRMQPVFNRLLDIRKLKGASTEMFWKGGFPGVNFEIDPRLAADDLEFDKEEFREDIRRWSDGLSRVLTTVGIKANNMATQVADPKNHITCHMQAIAMQIGAPLRILMGSEQSREASSQDKLTMNQRLRRKIRTFDEPQLVRPTINRLIAVGALPPPQIKKSSKPDPKGKGRFVVDWSDLNTVTDEDRANLSLKWTQAISQYVTTGMIHLIKPVDYFTLIVGMQPSDAKRLIKKVESEGGFQKLLKVDPSQSVSKNGTATNIAKGAGSKNKPRKRDTNQKRIEGKVS